MVVIFFRVAFSPRLNSSDLSLKYVEVMLITLELS